VQHRLIRSRGAATKLQYIASFVVYFLSIINQPSSQRELDPQIRMCGVISMPQCLRRVCGVTFITSFSSLMIILFYSSRAINRFPPYITFLEYWLSMKDVGPHFFETKFLSK
jgi:hypothetical protein